MTRFWRSRLIKSAFVVFLAGLLTFLPLSACNFPTDSDKDSEPEEGPLASALKPNFEESDCTSSGYSFTNISIDYLVDDDRAGPYMVCSLVETGEHGSVQVHVGITAYQSDKVDQYFEEEKASIKSFVDQSAEWNANPDVPEDAKDTITIIDDREGMYNYMITEDNNVQGCWSGRGYGVFRMYGRYVASIQYVSCELPTTEAYVNEMKKLKDLAFTAVERVMSLP